MISSLQNSYKNRTKKLRSILHSDSRYILPPVLSHSFSLFFKFLKIFIYFWEKDIQREWGRDRERGRHGIRSRLQALSCQHRAWHGARTHELWDHDLSRSWTLNQLTNLGAPSFKHFLYILDTRLFSDIFCTWSFPFYELCFHFLYDIFWCTKVINFDEAGFISFLFCCLCF